MSSISEPAPKSTRETILAAALKLFTEFGPGEIRLEDIAQRAGVSRQSVYIHFGSRAGLLLALVQYVDTDGILEGLVQRVFSAPNPLDALDAVAHLHAEYSPLVYPVARVFMTGRYEDEALKVGWEDRMEARRNVYRFVIEWTEREGLLGLEWEVESATEMVFAITSWQVWELLVIDQGWPKEQYERYIRLALRRILTKAAL
jgi:AcrR family transcriptional regulator